MENGYVLLTEKEEMWAKLLMVVLQDRGIRYISEPVHGAAMVLRAGLSERLKIYVPVEKSSQAQELMDDLFSGEDVK